MSYLALTLRGLSCLSLSLLLSACGGGGGGSTPQPSKSSTPIASSLAASSKAVASSIAASSSPAPSSTPLSSTVSSALASSSATSLSNAINTKLIDPNASAKTQAVYDYLRSIWGKKTLSGQQDLTWQDAIDMYQRVADDTGKAPAVMGYDFMNYTRSWGGSGYQQTEEAITHWNRGGLVSLCWHWRDPSRATTEFYTNKTTFKIPVVNGALDTSSAAYTQMNTDIDIIAAELKTLQTAGVPVLWRPLHEASGNDQGGWFWWGRARTDGVDPAQAQVLLWRHLYDRLTNTHGLHNLIWVWNGQKKSWYPGDAYVDIVSQDVYDGAKRYGSQINLFNATTAYSDSPKMVAMSENSNIPDPDNMATDKAQWLWFMVWNDSDTAAGVTDSGNFWTGEYYNTNAHKTKVYNHNNVITLDELPAF